MYPHRPAIEQRILAALHASPARIPWLIGASGTGRTSALLRLRDTLGPHQCQYVNVERIATTPERFQAALVDASPFDARPAGVGTARAAFDATLDFFENARGSSGGTFLLDEVLEFKTFESFPGLRHTLRELLTTLGRSGNRFVLSTRYARRAYRALKEAPTAFEIIPVPDMGVDDVKAMLPTTSEHHVDEELAELAGAIQVLSLGRPLYVRAITEALATHTEGAGDPVAALTGVLVPGATLSNACHMIYELRLHRARGYGALKAILDILAEEESLTLTAIAQRMHRTPGSTKDYLTWLEDVDLIAMQQKRYRYTDPLLRLWVRLHCRPTPPSLDRVAREVQEYALSRLPKGERRWVSVATQRLPEPARQPLRAGDNRSWEMVEID